MNAPRSVSRAILVILATGLCFAPAAQAQDDQTSAPKIIRKSGGVLQGTATHRVTPTYPALAKAARISGSVVVEVTTDEEGNVVAARALSGHPLLKDAAVDAARQWKFAPTLLGGTPVKVIGTIVFNFSPGNPTSLDEAKKAVQAEPYSAEAHFALGEAYSGEGIHEEAVKAYSEAVQLKPDYLAAYKRLAQSYRRLGRMEEATKSYSRALDYFPDSDEILVSLGSIYFLLGKLEEAERHLIDAVRIKDSSATVHEFLGEIYHKQGKLEQARAEWEKALSLSDQADQIARLKERLSGRIKK